MTATDTPTAAPSGAPFHSTAGASDSDDGRTFTVTGQDWDSVTDGLMGADEERVIVNMGPQHPSTHGVLRLILELEGETVRDTRAGIGYLHTGIEKNMEFRSWTQGVTFVTRADYLAPLFNEAAYVGAVEKLLNITDQIPQRALDIRIMMMELNRIASHLVAIATGGMEIGALTVMTIGFRDREKILDVFEHITGLRMNMAYIRPGGVSTDLPDDGLDKVRECIAWLEEYLPEYADLCNENPIFKGRLRKVGYLDLSGCLALGATGPVIRATGYPLDLRKSQPYWGYDTYDFEVCTQDTADAYGRFLIRLAEMWESLKIVRQAVDLLEKSAGEPIMVGDRKIAWPAQLSVSSDGAGQLPRPHPPHHGRVDGSADPPLQAGHRRLPRPAGPGLFRDRVTARRARLPRGLRRRYPALPGAPAGPILCQPAVRGGHVRGRHGRGCHRRCREHRPGHGWSGPLITEQTREEMRTIMARYPQPRSALLPMLHLVQSTEGLVTPEGIEVCAAELGITAAEVAAVATFYTMYKRHAIGDYHVGVCTNTLCAVMGGDAILERLEEHLGVGNDETTEDQKITLEHIECNAACDYAPVMTVNWEFMDNQTPESAVQLVDDLRAGVERTATRGARLCTWRQAERVLAGFPDGRANEGPTAGPASLVGLEVANQHGWTSGAAPYDTASHDDTATPKESS